MAGGLSPNVLGTKSDCNGTALAARRNGYLLCGPCLSSPLSFLPGGFGSGLSALGDQGEGEALFGGVVAVFAAADALRGVDAGVAGEEVADDGGDAGEGAD